MPVVPQWWSICADSRYTSFAANTKLHRLASRVDAKDTAHRSENLLSSTKSRSIAQVSMAIMSMTPDEWLGQMSMCVKWPGRPEHIFSARPCHTLSSSRPAMDCTPVICLGFPLRMVAFACLTGRRVNSTARFTLARQYSLGSS